MTGRHVVVAIGIDGYQQWPKLHNAVSDADGMVAILERLGFVQVRSALRDTSATGQAIDGLVGELEPLLGSEDSLVVFFAGHGATRSQKVGRRQVDTGYLVPVDGADGVRGAASWIELEPWLRGLARLPPRHILVVLDACFSGAALSVIRWGRGSGSLPGLPFEVANTKHSRLLIASTLEEQRAQDDGPAPGHSLFTGCLIEALSGGAKQVGERDGRAVTIGSELAHYVRHRVQSYGGRPGRDQTPDFGTFDHDDRGEMYIPLLVDRAPVLAHGSATGLAAGSVPVSASPQADPVVDPTSPPAPSENRSRMRWWWLAGASTAALACALLVTRQPTDDQRARTALAAPATEPPPNEQSPAAPDLGSSRAAMPPSDPKPESAAPMSTERSAVLNPDHGVSSKDLTCARHIAKPAGVLVSWDGVEHTVPVDVPIGCGEERVVLYHRPGESSRRSRSLLGTIGSKPVTLSFKPSPVDEPTAVDTGVPADETSGHLVLTLTPACKVAIDGTWTDHTTSKIDRSISAGRHHLILQNAAERFATEDVEIEAGKTTQRAIACPH